VAQIRYRIITAALSCVRYPWRSWTSVTSTFTTLPWLRSGKETRKYQSNLIDSVCLFVFLYLMNAALYVTGVISKLIRRREGGIGEREVLKGFAVKCHQLNRNS
jgi:hypothetical protein